jgi:hypothetical protein
MDVLLQGPIDHFTGAYMKVRAVGTVNGLHYIVVDGVGYNDIPNHGVVRIIEGTNKNFIFRYGDKFVYPSSGNIDGIVLAASANDNSPYVGSIGDVVELLHKEFTCPCVRLQFGTNTGVPGSYTLQFKVGILDMSKPYELDNPQSSVDDFVRGMRPGYTVSGIYQQNGTWSGTGTQPVAIPSGFSLNDGGLVSNTDHWNVLEIMLRDNQVWVWWNQLLIAPNAQLSALLPLPVAVTTAYFPINTGRAYGKCGLRMWPGSKLRRMELRTQSRLFSEFTYGQLMLS